MPHPEKLKRKLLMPEKQMQIANAILDMDGWTGITLNVYALLAGA